MTRRVHRTGCLGETARSAADAGGLWKLSSKRRCECPCDMLKSELLPRTPRVHVPPGLRRVCGQRPAAFPRPPDQQWPLRP